MSHVVAEITHTHTAHIYIYIYDFFKNLKSLHVNLFRPFEFTKSSDRLNKLLVDLSGIQT